MNKRNILSFLFILFLFLIFTYFIAVNISTVAYAGIGISEEATEGIDSLNKILFKLIEGAGDILLILGVWKYGIGMTSDHPQELSKGVSFLIMGAALANIQSLMGI